MAKNSTQKRFIKLKRDYCYCCYCGKARTQSIEHLFPQEIGGNNGEFNVRVACIQCNQEKGNMTPKEYVAFLEQKLIRAKYYQQFSNTFKDQMIGNNHINDHNPDQYYTHVKKL